MVGGVVVEVIGVHGKLWVNTAEVVNGEKTGDECAIYVALDGRSARIRPGDWLWWQGVDVHWTPVSGDTSGMPREVTLTRIGFSGVNRPQIEESV